MVWAFEVSPGVERVNDMGRWLVRRLGEEDGLTISKSYDSTWPKFCLFGRYHNSTWHDSLDAATNAAVSILTPLT